MEEDQLPAIRSAPKEQLKQNTFPGQPLTNDIFLHTASLVKCFIFILNCLYVFIYYDFNDFNVQHPWVC